MKSFIRSAIPFLICSAAMLFVATAGAADMRDPDAIGKLSDPAWFGKVMTITPETRTVNVSQRDVVKFVYQPGGKSFVWNFDTRNWASFDLSAVAPAGVIPSGQHVMAYVAEIVTDAP